jgi:hypothetical protein
MALTTAALRWLEISTLDFPRLISSLNIFLCDAISIHHRRLLNRFDDDPLMWQVQRKPCN